MRDFSIGFQWAQLIAGQDYPWPLLDSISNHHITGCVYGAGLSGPRQVSIPLRPRSGNPGCGSASTQPVLEFRVS